MRTKLNKCAIGIIRVWSIN